jgi:hypothetical protein
MTHCSVCGNLFRFCACIDRTPWVIADGWLDTQPTTHTYSGLKRAKPGDDPLMDEIREWSESLIDPRHPSQWTVPITEPTIIQAGDDEYLAIPINLSAEDMKAEIKRVRDLFAMAVADDDVADEAEEFLRGLT